MLLQTAASDTERVRAWRPGLWQFQIAQDPWLLAGVSERSTTLEDLRAQLIEAHGLALVEQVHGASIASVESCTSADPIPGCDALATQLPGLALVIRTADCVPIVVWDPVQRVVALAHAGWRGLASFLPMRLVRFLQTRYVSHPQDLFIGIGPAIRVCCYEVGEEFVPRFGPFVHTRHGRRVCDLVGCATQQLVATGVRTSRVVDCGQCTACQPSRWHSVRREGEAGGRLLSFVLIRPGSEVRRQKAEDR